MIFRAALAAVLLVFELGEPSPTLAQTSSASNLPPSDFSQNASGTTQPSAVIVPICTDRPTKANVACTVPQGAFQVETDLINWTHNSTDGVRTDTILYTSPTLKYGIGSNTDIEVSLVPYETTHTHSTSDTDKVGGLGDLYVRLKQSLTNASSRVQVGLIPYTKAPTAKMGVGNGKVEGGVIMPVIFSLPGGVSLNFGPELDILADSDLHGHHAQLVSLINLSRSFGKATLFAEFWNAQNLDPAGTVHQYSADVAVAYLVTPVWQLDAGANFGLNPRNRCDADLCRAVHSILSRSLRR